MSGRSDEEPGQSGLGDLAVPRIPGWGDEAADAQAAALLASSGCTTPRVALASPISIVQAAGARLLGASGEDEARGDLVALATDAGREETVQVEAAYALARLGDPRGTPELRRVLELPIEASPAPLQAAGALAWAGDPTGLAVVRRGLASSNPVTAIVATKQLPAFALLQGQATPDGTVDVPLLYRLALDHPDERVVREARAQLGSHPDAADHLADPSDGATTEPTE